jgi:hypothetical protein
MTATANGYLHAVHAREYTAAAPDGAEVWKYAFPLHSSDEVDDVHIRSGSWTGVFECAHAHHLEVLPWENAHALVVAAANAVYIVDPRNPELFSGVDAPIGISGVTFDESREHMFVADSLRVYAFSSDRLFRWISEPLEGYDAHLQSCGRSVLAVELRPLSPTPDGAEPPPAVIRLRTEDGTILRPRFGRSSRSFTRPAAA